MEERDDVLVFIKHHIRKMDMQYKPSMFNRVIERKERMIIYNSFGGTKSLLEISPEKVEKVKGWLNSAVIGEIKDSDFCRLIEKGYLVREDVNEKKLREYRCIKYLTDNRLHLVLHITQACNFRCSYCYMDFKPVYMHADVQQGIVNYIRQNIQRFKSVRIDWFGGEPLMGMDIIERISKEVMEICREHKKPYVAMVTTNGYNLTAENVKKLMSCKVTHIAVTIDGTKEMHDSQRTLANGDSTFDQIINNLRYIRDNIKSRTLTVSIRTNITRNHIPKLNEYYAFYDNEFGYDHRFSLFIRPVADYGGEKVKKMRNVFISDMQDVYDTIVNIQGNIKFFPNFIDLEEGGYTCTARDMYKYTIGCDGKVSKCDESLEEAIGHIYQDGHMQIDEKKCADWFLANPKEECDNCFFSGSCFMELCPKARNIHNSDVCRVNFKEIDSLIWMAANTYRIERL